MRAFDYHRDDFVEGIKTATGGANVILDMVGGDYVQKNLRAATFRGRIVSIAFLRGSKVEVDLMPDSVEKHLYKKVIMAVLAFLREAPGAPRRRRARPGGRA